MFAVDTDATPTWFLFKYLAWLCRSLANAYGATGPHILHHLSFSEIFLTQQELTLSMQSRYKLQNSLMHYGAVSEPLAEVRNSPPPVIFSFSQVSRVGQYPHIHTLRQQNSAHHSVLITRDPQEGTIFLRAQESMPPAFLDTQQIRPRYRRLGAVATPLLPHSAQSARLCPTRARLPYSPLTSITVYS